MVPHKQWFYGLWTVTRKEKKVFLLQKCDLSIIKHLQKCDKNNKKLAKMCKNIGNKLQKCDFGTIIMFN